MELPISTDPVKFGVVLLVTLSVFTLESLAANKSGAPGVSTPVSIVIERAVEVAMLPALSMLTMFIECPVPAFDPVSADEVMLQAPVLAWDVVVPRPVLLS